MPLPQTLAFSTSSLPFLGGGSGKKTEANSNLVKVKVSEAKWGDMKVWQRRKRKVPPVIFSRKVRKGLGKKEESNQK